jgi:hypothetical protein
LSIDKFLWFPTFDSLWISIHQNREKKQTKNKLGKIKKTIFILKNRIKEVINLKVEKEQIKGQKE